MSEYEYLDQAPAQSWMEQSLEEAVFQAIRAASMCWEPTPTGVFQSDVAVQIGNGLIEWITEWHRSVQ